jgi:hypothetical protein
VPTVQQYNTHLYPIFSSPILGLQKYCPQKYSPIKILYAFLVSSIHTTGRKAWSSRSIVGRGRKNPSTHYLDFHCRCKFQPWRWRVKVLPKCWQVSPRLHGVTGHKTTVQPAKTIKFVVDDELPGSQVPKLIGIYSSPLIVNSRHQRRSTLCSQIQTHLRYRPTDVNTICNIWVTVHFKSTINREKCALSND